MKKKTSDIIIEHHNELFRKFGESPVALGEAKDRTNLRFKVLSEIGNLNNSNILDVGCGFGYFLSFLKKKKRNVKYVGVDINSDFIEIAKRRNPNYIFKVADIEKTKIKSQFDWVFAIGIASKADSYNYIENLLKEMFRISKKGVVMNFITSYVDYKVKGTFYTSPERVFKIAKKLTKRVLLRHDYLPFEFCLYLYKNDKIKTFDNTFHDFH